MKKTIGSLFCILAIMLIFGKLLAPKPDTTEHNIQDGALIAVLLTIGIPLSQGRKKPKDSSAK